MFSHVCLLTEFKTKHDCHVHHNVLLSGSWEYDKKHVEMFEMEFKSDAHCLNQRNAFGFITVVSVVVAALVNVHRLCTEVNTEELLMLVSEHQDDRRKNCQTFTAQSKC